VVSFSLEHQNSQVGYTMSFQHLPITLLTLVIQFLPGIKLYIPFKNKAQRKRVENGDMLLVV
jgi:hypothetical protein